MESKDIENRWRALRRLRSLLDVPGLETLAEVCRRHRVSLTCHGGTARRIAAAAMAAAAADGSDDAVADWSIFDCVPFNSDLDLLHSGAAAQTAAILDDIYNVVPFAEHLRWELRSEEEQAPFDAAKTYAPIIPLCLVSLSTHRGWLDPWDGLADLAGGTLRFVRNGFYRESPRFKAGQDIELIQVLLYYKVLAELPQFEPDPAGLAAARGVILETQDDFASLTRLQESAYLRSRLRYFLSAIKALAPRALAPSGPWVEALAFNELEPIMYGLGGEAQLLALLRWDPEQGHLAVTSRLAGDTYRLPPVNDEAWTTGDAAQSALYDAAGDLTKRRADRRGSAGRPAVSAAPVLSDDQRIVMASPLLACASGLAPSGQDSEFLHFAVRAPQPFDAPLTDLAALCFIADNNRTAAVAVPTACMRPPGDDTSLNIRCNLGRALNTHPNSAGRDVRVFLSQWQGVEPRLAR